MSELKINQIGGLPPPRENRKNPSRGRVFSGQGLSPCLDTFQGGGLQPHVVCYDSYNKKAKENVCGTLTTNAGDSGQCGSFGVFEKDKQKKYRIRKLTPKECFRLQGWSDIYFKRAELVNSNAQLYKQAGNGVTVDVIYNIAKNIPDFSECKENG